MGLGPDFDGTIVAAADQGLTISGVGDRSGVGAVADKLVNWPAGGGMPEVDAGAAGLVEDMAVGARADLLGSPIAPTGKGIEMFVGLVVPDRQAGLPIAAPENRLGRMDGEAVDVAFQVISFLALPRWPMPAADGLIHGGADQGLAVGAEDDRGDWATMSGETIA